MGPSLLLEHTASNFKSYAYLGCPVFSLSQVAATAPAAALGAHMVKRLRAFAGMSRMKRLALVVLARTLTDNDVKRLRVRGRLKCTSLYLSCLADLKWGRERGGCQRSSQCADLLSRPAGSPILFPLYPV